MATDITNDGFTARSSDVHSDDKAALKTAHAQAVAELNRIHERASIEDNEAADNANYSVHEVNGVGRYVIPPQIGWEPLIAIVHDAAARIGFAIDAYPLFDGIVSEHFQNPQLLAPDTMSDVEVSYSDVSAYVDLRDNIAAVRNFLMQMYYADTPAGITPEKARQALVEIAAFVGDGMHNNWRFFNGTAIHDPTKPFIDLMQAQASEGKGAQYIYEKILDYQRHSNWMRPFTPVMALFGGKAIEDWKLAMAEALAEEDALSRMASDLDAIGDHLLHTADNMNGVAHISEAVRRDAVDIARDILRKLKLSLGDLLILDGLKLKPTDDMAALGAIKGVAMIYERLLAWARGNNDATILQHPSIIAATRAIGQLGYLAKGEAMRMATMAGNKDLAASIGEQLKRLPASYRTLSGARFGDLLDTVEQGIHTIVNRTQQVTVSGVRLGKSVDNLGTSIDAPPTAGMANLTANQEKGNERNAQLITAQQLAQLAQQNRAQAASRQPQTPGSPQQSTAVQRGASAGRSQPRANSPIKSATALPVGQMTPAQLAAAQRNFNLLHHLQEEEHHHHDEMLRLQRLQQQQLLLAQQKAAASAAKAKAAAAKIDPNMLKGFQSATNLKGVTGSGEVLKPGRSLDPNKIYDTRGAKPAVPETKPQARHNEPAAITLTPDDERLRNAIPAAPQQPNPRGRNY